MLYCDALWTCYAHCLITPIIIKINNLLECNTVSSDGNVTSLLIISRFIHCIPSKTLVINNWLLTIYTHFQEGVMSFQKVLFFRVVHFSNRPNLRCSFVLDSRKLLSIIYFCILHSSTATKSRLQLYIYVFLYVCVHCV